MKTSTYNIVREAVEALPFSSAEEIAWQAELSVTTVRKYLAELVQRGLVTKRDELRMSDVVHYGRTRYVHVNIYSPVQA